MLPRRAESTSCFNPAATPFSILAGLMNLEALDDLLADVLAKSRQYRSTSAFARLLFEFRRVAESYPITQEQMDDLVTELQRIWAEDRGVGATTTISE